MPALNESQKAFLRAGYIAVVTTLRADGSPHSTLVWIDCDGEDVLFNTARGRAKVRHLLVDSRVSIMTTDGGDFHRWLAVDGRAAFVHEGADAHIQSLRRPLPGRHSGARNGAGDRPRAARAHRARGLELASASMRPAAKSSRAACSSGGRSRLPTWSARKGGVVRRDIQAPLSDGGVPATRLTSIR